VRDRRSLYHPRILNARKAIILLLVAVWFAAPAATSTTGRFFMWPDVSHSTIAFSDESDHLKCPRIGRRHHAPDETAGVEAGGKFPPDATWIAFTAQYAAPSACVRFQLTRTGLTNITFTA
jgi:hypothetical protein